VELSGHMQANFVAPFLAASLIVTGELANLGVSQNLGEIRERERNTADGVVFSLVGNVRVIWLLSHVRKIAVFVEPQAFTLENIRSIVLHLSESYPAEDHLHIDVISNDEQRADAVSWFAEIQSYTFGNVLPPVSRCASAIKPPLSAQYFRIAGSENLYYNPAVGDSIQVEFKHSSPDCGASGDVALDLVDASIRGCTDVVQQLLKRGANPNGKARYGGSALVEASFWGTDHYETVELLLDAGADINQTSSSGWTALMAAVFGNRSRTMDLLLSRGADVNLRSEDGRTALILAVQRGNATAVKQLLALGADSTVRDGYGKTALVIAAELQNKNLIRLLKKAGASQ
jgi:hypothetical protein